MNKKGADLAIGTIVLIILALVVLVVIIYGFTVGWGNLFQNIIGYGGGDINVQSVVQACNVACSTGSDFDYCQRQRNVIFESGKDSTVYSCDGLSKRVPAVGVDDCSIDCGNPSVFDCKRWSGEVRNRDQCKTNDKISFFTFEHLTSVNQVCCVSRKTCKQWVGEWTTKAKCDEKVTNNQKTHIIIGSIGKQKSVNPDFSIPVSDGAPVDGQVCCVPRVR